jgi:Cytochrome b(C-terminal)/b6/petD
MEVNTLSHLCPLLAAAGEPLQQFLSGMSGFLGGYYITLAVMNGVMALYLWQKKDDPGKALVWVFVAGLFVILAPLAASGYPSMVPHLPQFIQDSVNWGLGRVQPHWASGWPQPLLDAINWAAGPTIYTVGIAAFLGVMFVFRRFFVQPLVAWALLDLSLLAMGLAMADPNFAAIVTKPDNVPIVSMVFLLGYFTWLGAYKAVQNDDRMARGEPPLEKLDDEKVLVWPDLVYTELICMIALTALLLVWAIVLKAPLEEPASSVKTPNPSKAPWYFLGLQEMLVYFDPWYAGVVLPSLVIFGLMAIPYLDFNKQGNGYYTIDQRKFSYLVFQFGFLVLWVTLIILGTFLRGPNWNIFGLFEQWDAHKVDVLNNKNLSYIFWVNGLNMSLPQAPTGASGGTQFLYILLREAPGIIAVLAYFIILPPLLAVTVFRKFFVKLGFIRYMVMSNLLLLMMTLPMKMVLRWTLNLKYIIAIPEYFLNF